MIQYTPPTTDDLQRLKERLGYTGEQMAELASVAGGQQWRKYTGGAEPRALNLHMAFFIAARLALSPDELRRVANRMEEFGAQIDAGALIEKPGPAHDSDPNAVAMREGDSGPTGGTGSADTDQMM